jgi:3-mercaptopyruvate sulfurtransferase SseA
MQFVDPLGTKEVMNIVKSVSGWVAQNYDAAKFSEIQSERAKRRWTKHRQRLSSSDMVENLTPRKALIKDTRPWEALGISRATWYNRKKAGTIPSSKEDAHE